MEKGTAQPGKRGAFTRFLDGVEWLGNLLPHPVSLFALLALSMILLSGLFASLGLSVEDPRPGAGAGPVRLPAAGRRAAAAGGRRPAPAPRRCCPAPRRPGPPAPSRPRRAIGSGPRGRSAGHRWPRPATSPGCQNGREDRNSSGRKP